MLRWSSKVWFLHLFLLLFVLPIPVRLLLQTQFSVKMNWDYWEKFDFVLVEHRYKIQPSRAHCITLQGGTKVMVQFNEGNWTGQLLLFNPVVIAYLVGFQFLFLFLQLFLSDFPWIPFKLKVFSYI